MEKVKIESVNIHNCKNISEFTAFLGGKSAHITGKNGVGKSTAVRVLWDRLVGNCPAEAVKQGKDDGHYILNLTDGGRFEWLFNTSGKEIINYYNSDGEKLKGSQLKALIERYFSNSFNIQKFLTTTEPRKRLQMISELIKVDLTTIQSKYKTVCEVRREEKNTLKNLLAQNIKRPVFNSNIDLDTYTVAEEKRVHELKAEIQTEKDRLNSEYLRNKKANDEALILADQEYNEILQKHNSLENSRRKWTEKYNVINDKRQINIEIAKQKLDQLFSIEIDLKRLGFINSDTSEALFDFIALMPKPKAVKRFVSNPIPEKQILKLPDPMPSNFNLKLLQSDLSDVEQTLKNKETEISDLKAEKKVYDNQLISYNEHKKKIDEQTEIVENCEKVVNEVLNEIRAIVKNAKLPEEFSIDLTEKNDILFNGFPITNETLASSAIYIASFKLAVFHLDLFRAVHFDVSYLDYDNRQKVVEEALKLDIQLITESPANNKNESDLQMQIYE